MSVGGISGDTLLAKCDICRTAWVCLCVCVCVSVWNKSQHIIQFPKDVAPPSSSYLRLSFHFLSTPTPRSQFTLYKRGLYYCDKPWFAAAEHESTWKLGQGYRTLTRPVQSGGCSAAVSHRFCHAVFISNLNSQRNTNTVYGRIFSFFFLPRHAFCR